MDTTSNSVHLELNYNSGLVAEVALVVVATRERITKARQKIVNFHWADGEAFVDGNVDAAADDEIKCVVAGALAGDDAALRNAVLVKIPVEIAVRSAEKSLNEWLKMLHADFCDRTNVVGEQITLSRNGTRPLLAIRARGYLKGSCIAAVALKLSQDSHVLAEIVRDRSTASVQIEGGNDVVVLRIGVNKGIVERDLRLRGILREQHAAKTHHY